MKEKLPKVFANKFDVRNINQGSSRMEEESISIDDIFDSSKYLFKRRYIISLKNGKVINSSIISKIDNKLLTIDNEKIDINDIERIVEKK